MFNCKTLIWLFRDLISVHHVSRVKDATNKVLKNQKHVRLVIIATILPECFSANPDHIKMKKT